MRMLVQRCAEPRLRRRIALCVLTGVLAGTLFSGGQRGDVAFAAHEHCGVDDGSDTTFNHGLGDGADTDRFVHPFIQTVDPYCPDITRPEDMRANVELRRADGRFRGGYFLVASADCQGCRHLHLSRDTNFPECHYGWYGSAFAQQTFNKEITSHTHFHHAFCGKVNR